MKRQLLLFTLTLFLTAATDDAIAQDASIGDPSVRIGENFRIHPSGNSQTETFITRSPTNNAILFASANTIDLLSGFISEGIYVSTDAGQTWTGSDTCNGSPITFHGGDPGIAIDDNGTFILIRLAVSPLSGLYGHFSTDNGATWSSQRTIATEDQDRATLAADGNPGSSFYGRAYGVWVRFAPPFPVFYAYTDDGGSTWSTPAQVNNPVQRSQGGELAIGTDGTVYVAWAAVLSVSPFTEDFAGFARSTNGGATWSATENIFDMNGITGTFPEKSNIRVNGLPRIDVDKSGGPRHGWLYIVTGEKNIPPAGSDPDILLHRSTDGGQSWSAGIRVNQDPLNNGKFQYFPAIHVDDDGGVNVLYYDDRGTTSDSAAVWLSRSTDGGFTWRDHEISTHNFKPTPIGGLGQGYQGDNIGMTSVGDTLWPVWMDNSTGLYQVWTCPVRISALPTSFEDVDHPATTRLGQNYPNPFNPVTRIEYSLAGRRHVVLTVFDILGREVATLVAGEREAGGHSVAWDASGLGSGVYYYRLTAGEFVQTRKLVLLE